MKLRKLLVSLSLAALVCLTLAIPALGADVELGAFTAINNDTQKGWLTDGVDGVASSLTAEQFTAAKYLVLELSAPPTGGMQVIWQGDGGAWAWNQKDGVIGDDGSAETTIVIDLAATLIDYEGFKASTQVKMFLGYYSNNVDDLGITKAYLTDTAPGAAEPDAEPDTDEPAPENPVTDDGVKGNKESNPQTGDSTFLFIAIGALVLTAGAATVILRKKVTQ